jgi:hypothetical protein
MGVKIVQHHVQLPGPSNLTLVTLEYRVKQKENGLKSRFDIKG